MLHDISSNGEDFDVKIRDIEPGKDNKHGTQDDHKRQFSKSRAIKEGPTRGPRYSFPHRRYWQH